ncbi:hypothetical protein D3C79_1052070 [compost metagenome]
MLYPHHLAGDFHAMFAHQLGLVGEPLPMGLQIAVPRQVELLRSEQAGHRQGLGVVERHDVQWQLHRQR